MPIHSKEIYRSANGDQWHLVGDTHSKRSFVRHKANLASGGQVADIEVADFLKIGGSGPEFAALRDIIRQQQEVPIASTVKGIIASHLKLADNKVVPEASLMNDLHADSLDVLEIVMSIEDAFGLYIPEKATEKIDLVKDAIECVEMQNART